MVKAYYKAVGEKNIEKIEKYLHPDVQLIGPLAKLSGKEAVLDATENFTSLFNTLTIRVCLGSEEQVMVVYELDCPPPLGVFSSAVLMTFEKDLISKIELFYDARPFEKMKEEIFSSSAD